MCHRVITVLSLVAVTHGFSSLPQASPSPTPMQMPGPPPSPSPPPPAFQCQDYNTFAQDIFASGPCSAISSFCNHQGATAQLSYGPLVKGLCPVTCGACANYCTDQDAMMNTWAGRNPSWPTSCATATPAEQQALYLNRSANIYLLACGGTGPKCMNAPPSPPPPPPAPTASPSTTAVPSPSPQSTACQDMDDNFMTSSLGVTCAGAGAGGFCASSYAPFVTALCPVTCGTCSAYCTNLDSAMAMWAQVTQQTSWPITCASATGTAYVQTGFYQAACGADSGKCSTAATPSPSPGACTDTDNAGTTSPLTDKDGYGCAEYYTAQPPGSYCGGQYDDDDFSSSVLCCACGGGVQL